MIETFEDEGGGIFAPIVAPIVGIAKGFVLMGELVVTMIEILINMFKIIPALFNPDKLINDVIFGVTQGIPSLISGFMNKFTFNETKSTNNSGLFGIEDNNKKVCIKPTLINLIVLVLCPPLALYIDRGFKGIFLVIVCALLTYYLYYFPGFLFAALHILC